MSERSVLDLPQLGRRSLQRLVGALDGELVVLDAHGRSDFEALRRRLAPRRPTVEYAAQKLHLPSSLSTCSSYVARPEALPLLSASSYQRTFINASAAPTADLPEGLAWVFGSLSLIQRTQTCSAKSTC